jgi:phosphinothricin acetyltransferase
MRRTIRGAAERDAEACALIYSPYVLETPITFELEPPSSAEMAARIAAAVREHAWLVLEEEGRVRGYAYGGPMHRRPAYRWSCEVSVYVEQGLRRTGAGRALYEELLRRLAARGYQLAVAGITLPNDASVALHSVLGFEPVGTFRAVGYKLGRWHDVAWMQRELVSQRADPPEEPS